MSKEKDLELQLEECKTQIMKYQELTDKKASVEVPGMKVIVTKEDNWDVVFMILVLVLGTYIGIKLINRWLK
jgi:ribosomal protein S12 methylthiotransferase accessory factor YcaO